MSNRRVYRGGTYGQSAPYVRPAYRGIDESHRIGSRLGFRLVHDESDHRDRGGSWFAPAEQAKHGNGTDNRPFATFNTTGFRLARDEEDM